MIFQTILIRHFCFSQSNLAFPPEFSMLREADIFLHNLKFKDHLLLPIKYLSIYFPAKYSGKNTPKI